MATTKPPKAPVSSVDHAKIVEDAMPGWKIVDQGDALQRRETDLGATPNADVTSSSMEAMKHKYHNATPDAVGTTDSSTVEDNATLATHVVTVEAPSGERKTIGIRDGKITWHQG